MHRAGQGAGKQGRTGCGSIGCLPSSPICSCWRLHKESSVYWWPWSQWEGALLPGRSSRQTVSVALKDPVVSFCGRPPLTPEGEVPRCFPCGLGLTDSLSGSSRDTAWLRPSSRTSENTVRLCKSTLQWVTRMGELRPQCTDLALSLLKLISASP